MLHYIGTMVRDKFRIRFRKCQDLRLVSHHDLMRCFERMLRRSELPFHSTSGFNPKPRLVFALSLALGIEGCAEVVELELDAELPECEVHERLAAQAPPGLEIISVRRMDPKTTGQAQRVRYRIEVPADRLSGLEEPVRALLAAEHCWVERTRPRSRRVDVRPYLVGLRVLPGALEMELQVTPNGTARPEEVLTVVGLGDLAEQGRVLQRTALELHDE
jgi:radical SAM-linked protein